MFERRNNRYHSLFFISIDFQKKTNNDHLKQRRNISYLWFHRASIRHKYAYFYFLQLTSGRNSWSGLHVNTTESSESWPCKTINLVSKLNPKRHDIWLKLSLPIFRLDFETYCFFITVSMFSCCLKGGRAISVGHFFTWEPDLNTQAFSR